MRETTCRRKFAPSRERVSVSSGGDSTLAVSVETGFSFFFFFLLDSIRKRRVSKLFETRVDGSKFQTRVIFE